MNKMTSREYSEYLNLDYHEDELKYQAIKGAGESVVARVLSYGIQMIGTIVLARLLTPDDFGLITMVATVSLLLMNVGINGFTEAIIQEPQMDHERINGLFWINFLINLTLTILLILISPLLARFYNEPRLMPVCSIMSLTIFFTGLLTIHQAIWARRMEFNKYRLNEVVSMLFSTVVGIGMALSGFGVWSLAARRIAQPMCASVGAWMYCGWRPGRPGGYRRTGSLVKFAAHVYGNFTLNYFTRNIDKVLLGMRFDARSLGQYNNAYHLFVMPVNQLVHPLSNVAIAALSKLRAAHLDRFVQFFNKALMIMGFFGIGISVFFTLGGRDMILLLLGPKWHLAGDIITIFGPAIAVMLLKGTAGWLHLSLGRPDRWVRWSLFEVVFTTVAFLVGLPFGPKGMAWAFTLSLYLLLLPSIHYAGVPIKLSALKALAGSWRFILAGILSGSVGYYLLYLQPDMAGYLAAAPLALRLTVTTVYVAISYLLTCVVLYGGFSPIGELVLFFREMRDRRSGINNSGQGET